MALGGGVFTTQNKILPGAYINFVSAARASAILSDRGIAAMPFTGDWGPEDEVFVLDAEEFQAHAAKYFGYDEKHPQTQMIRELFCHATKLYLYRLNSGTVKASNTYATAKYGGSRGNALSIVVQDSPEGGFEVATMLGGSEMDIQTVQTAEELQDNDYVVFNKEAALTVTAGEPLTGGADGQGRTGENYQRFLKAIEPYSFHALGCNSGEKEVIDLFIAFTKRMRDKVGAKFQTVVYRAENADYEGIVSVENRLLDVDENLFGEFSLVYWVTGLIAGCGVNQSNTNVVYDGAYKVDTDYTQQDLEDALKAGKFLLHRVGEQVRVLDDINTFVSFTDDKNEDFSSNQTIRVLDQIANDIASVFNTKYLGRVPNDAAGQMSLWNDIVTHHQELEKIRAIENFNSELVHVLPGNSKKSVVVQDAVTPVNAMTQLYMTVTVQ